MVSNSTLIDFLLFVVLICFGVGEGILTCSNSSSVLDGEMIFTWMDCELDDWETTCSRSSSLSVSISSGGDGVDGGGEWETGFVGVFCLGGAGWRL